MAFFEYHTFSLQFQLTSHKLFAFCLKNMSCPLSDLIFDPVERARWEIESLKKKENDYTYIFRYKPEGENEAGKFILYSLFQGRFTFSVNTSVEYTCDPTDIGDPSRPLVFKDGACACMVVKFS